MIENEKWYHIVLSWTRMILLIPVLLILIVFQPFYDVISKVVRLVAGI